MNKCKKILVLLVLLTSMVTYASQAHKNQSHAFLDGPIDLFEGPLDFGDDASDSGSSLRNDLGACNSNVQPSHDQPLVIQPYTFMSDDEGCVLQTQHQAKKQKRSVNSHATDIQNITHLSMTPVQAGQLAHDAAYEKAMYDGATETEAKKIAVKAYQIAYSKAYKALPKVKEKRKASDQAKSNKIKAYNKAWKQANSDKIKAYNKVYKKAWDQANSDKIKAWRNENGKKQKATYSANPYSTNTQNSIAVQHIENDPLAMESEEDFQQFCDFMSHKEGFDQPSCTKQELKDLYNLLCDDL